jgi:hypothetical protein
VTRAAKPHDARFGVLRYDAGASLLVEHGAEHRRFRGSSSGASRALLAEVGRVNLCFRGDSELRLGVEGVLLDGPSRAAKAHQLRPFRPSRPTPGRRRSARPIEVSCQ